MSDTLYEYISTTGVIVTDTTSLLTTVEGEFQSALGTNLDVDPSSPAGVLIAGEVTARAAVVRNNAALANQINPNQAGGVFLDAIAALTGLLRSTASYSTYSAVALAGAANLPVPAGTQAKTENGDIYQTNSTIMLDASGNGSVSMSAIVSGPIAAPSGTLTPVTNVLGLETFTAAENGTLGVTQQSDVSLRALRRSTLAKQGVALNGATLSAILNLPGVLGAQFLENYTAETVTTETIELVANSIWLCIDGGTASQIASTLLASKSQGCNWNGAQSEAATDPVTGQSYTVLWDIPTYIPFLIRVTCKQGNYTGALTSGVQNAVLAYGSNTVAENLPNGVDDPGITGFYVGNNVSPFEIAAAIQVQCPGIYISKVEVTTVAVNIYQTTEWDLNINQKATVNISQISVVTS